MSHWWHNYPWRMIQTNLRETDMADIDADTYAQQLADYGATVVTLNAAGIIASYQTSLDFQTQSPYLTGSSLRQLIDACHARGIRVIARMDFSKLRLPIYEQHPDWAYRDKDGQIVNYNGNVQTCPNGLYQKEKSLEILREVLTTHPFDGVFCNMSGFLVVDYSGVYHGPCHCENCRRLFKEQYGLEIPEKDNPKDPDYKKYSAFKSACIKSQKQRLIETVRSISPDLAINGVDYVRTESGTEIGITPWPYSASSNARQSAGPLRLRPADNASVDFMGFRYRDSSVSAPLLALRQWQNLANAGSTSLYIMGHLGNHKDRTALAASRPAFSFHKAHESLFCGLQSAARLLLVRRPVMARTDPEGYGWIRVLTESHIPFDEIRIAEITPDILARYDTVVLPGVQQLPAAQAAMVDSFVQSGGTVIATGACKGLSCLGAESIGCETGLMSTVFEIPQSEEFLFPRSRAAHYVVPGDTLQTIRWSENAKTLLRRVPEHPFGPPELCYYTHTEDTPALGITTFGQGRCVYLPWTAGSFYYQEGHDNTLHFLQDVLFEICEIPKIAPGLTPMVELTLSQKPGKFVIQLVNTSGIWGNSCFAPLPVQHITLRLSGFTSSNATALNGGHIHCAADGSDLLVTLDMLNEYEAIVFDVEN